MPIIDTVHEWRPVYFDVHGTWHRIDRFQGSNVFSKCGHSRLRKWTTEPDHHPIIEESDEVCERCFTEEICPW